MVVAVLMTVVSIRMVEQTGQNHGTTGGATCRRAKRVCEANPFGRQGVQVRRLNGIIAVTAKIGTEVIGHKEDDVGPCRCFETFLGGLAVTVYRHCQLKGKDHEKERHGVQTRAAKTRFIRKDLKHINARTGG